MYFKCKIYFLIYYEIIFRVTNYMNLISHDYHGDTNVFWSGGGLNINAPINAEDNDSVEDTIKRYLNYTIPGKLTLGIPMYARWWKLKDKNQTTIGSPYVSGKQNDYAFAPAFNYVSCIVLF